MSVRNARKLPESTKFREQVALLVCCRREAAQRFVSVSQWRNLSAAAPANAGGPEGPEGAQWAPGPRRGPMGPGAQKGPNGPRGPQRWCTKFASDLLTLSVKHLRGSSSLQTFRPGLETSSKKTTTIYLC